MIRFHSERDGCQHTLSVSSNTHAHGEYEHPPSPAQTSPYSLNKLSLPGTTTTLNCSLITSHEVFVALWKQHFLILCMFEPSFFNGSTTNRVCQIAFTRGIETFYGGYLIRCGHQQHSILIIFSPSVNGQMSGIQKLSGVHVKL